MSYGFWMMGAVGQGEPVASVSFVAASGTTFSTATSQNCTIPNDADEDDLLLAWVMHRDAITPPSGWTLVDTAGPFTSTGATQYTSLYKRIAEPGDGGSSTTWGQATSQRMAVHIQSFRKAGGCDVLSASKNTISGTGTASFVTPAVAQTGAGQMLASGASSVLAVNSAPNTMAVSPPWALTTPASSADTAHQIRLGCAYRIAEVSSQSATYAINSSDTINGWGAINALIG